MSYRGLPPSSTTTSSSSFQSSSLPPSLAQQQQALQQRSPFISTRPSNTNTLDTDFPALNSLPPSASHWPPNNNSNGILPQAQSQSQQPNSSGGGFTPDDFPALGGGPTTGGGGGGAGNGTLQSQQEAAHRANLLGSMNGISSSALPGGAGQRVGSASSSSTTLQQQQPQSSFGAAASSLPPPPLSGLPPPTNSLPLPPPPSIPPPPTTITSTQLSLPSQSIQSLPPPQQQILESEKRQPQRIPQTPAQQVLFSPADRYGLLGLLHIIKTNDSDLSMLSLGTDLSTLGLDLGGNDNLYSTFLSPWSPTTPTQLAQIEPEFTLPACYNVQPPPAQSKLGNFSDETLFFIFYSCPKDVMQEMAAHELYKHNWRYHKDLRLWLTKEAGTEPTQKTQSYERGSYIFFDPTLWERVRKDFVLVFESLERKNI